MVSGTRLLTEHPVGCPVLWVAGQRLCGSSFFDWIGICGVQELGQSLGSLLYSRALV